MMNEEMEKWRQQALMTSTAVMEAKNEVCRCSDMEAKNDVGRGSGIGYGAQTCQASYMAEEWPSGSEIASLVASHGNAHDGSDEAQAQNAIASLVASHGNAHDGSDEARAQKACQHPKDRQPSCCCYPQRSPVSSTTTLAYR
eukprot:1143536-Pelagomonas_calceolata.AAC.1